jgi:uncharacterized repeat protein (TIGR03803 family)
VFKVDTSGHETVLHNFTGGADGAYPDGGVILDPAGNLYGTTYYGGPANAGVVYKVDPTGNETLVYTFTGGRDGGSPVAGLTLAPPGILFGTSWAGGFYGVGAIFAIQGAVKAPASNSRSSK